MSTTNIAQKMKFSIKAFFSKCEQIRSFLRKQWLSDYLQDFCPNINRRYVDNIFVDFDSAISKEAFRII